MLASQRIGGRAVDQDPLERGALPADAPDTAPAKGYLETQPLTATPGMPMTDAIKLLDGRSEPRLIVLDEDGVTLRGLLCQQRLDRLLHPLARPTIATD